MSIGLHGQNLIFLISQPRAGSTLLQRILGSHPSIHTLSEPWIMLHPYYAIRNNGIEVEYDSYNTHTQAVRDFLQNISANTSLEYVYYEGVRKMYSSFYQRALETSGKELFLDKTPRYYHIIPELHRTFPDAKFIILLRNPLAVFNSMIKTWVQKDWFWLSETANRQDLLNAPKLLLRGIDTLGEECIVVQYEDLVTFAEEQIKKISDYLRIDYLPEISENFGKNLSRWQLGDQGDVYKYQELAANKVSAWEKHIDDPQVWRVTRDYLNVLGKRDLAKMGYSYDELNAVILQNRPSVTQRLFTFPLAFFTKSNNDRAFFERNIIRLINRIGLFI